MRLGVIFGAQQCSPALFLLYHYISPEALEFGIDDVAEPADVAAQGYPAL
jgi:hypothetical protein